MSNIIPYNELKSMATDTAKSGLFGLKSPEQAMALMMIAQSEDIHPMRAVMEYDIISGKPALKSTTVLSRFQQSGGSIEWLHTDSKKATAKFTHPQGGSITITWTIERAQKADLLKNDTWRKYPDQMLRARCIPEGVRAIYPACLSGMYSSDEVRDFAEPQPAPVVDTGEFLEAEVEPERTIDAEKKILALKLGKLGLNNKEIKGFAEYFELTDNLDKIIELNDDEKLLAESVKQYEGELNEN
jgi:hypothetical protein